MANLMKLLWNENPYMDAENKADRLAEQAELVLHMAKIIKLLAEIYPNCKIGLVFTALYYDIGVYKNGYKDKDGDEVPVKSFEIDHATWTIAAYYHDGDGFKVDGLNEFNGKHLREASATTFKEGRKAFRVAEEFAEKTGMEKCPELLKDAANMEAPCFTKFTEAELDAAIFDILDDNNDGTGGDNYVGMTLHEIMGHLGNVTDRQVEAALNRLVASSDCVYCVTSRLDENEIEVPLKEKHWMVF